MGNLTRARLIDRRRARSLEELSHALSTVAVMHRDNSIFPMSLIGVGVLLLAAALPTTSAWLAVVGLGCLLAGSWMLVTMVATRARRRVP